MKIIIFEGTPEEWRDIGGAPGVISAHQRDTRTRTVVIDDRAHGAGECSADEIRPWKSESYEQNRRYGRDREFLKRAVFRGKFNSDQIALFQLMLAEAALDSAEHESRCAV